MITPVLKDLPVDVVNSQAAPWFVTYNPYCIPCSAHYTFEPFPVHEFSCVSPHEDHVIVAHYGIEKFAKDAGYADVPTYLKALIAAAAETSHLLQGRK